MVDGFKQGAQTGDLKEHGEKLGFKYGGSVKNTSSEFVQKTEKQDSMDTGTQPARKGRNQQEIEAGGTKKMTPGYKKGGYKKGGKKAMHGGKMEYAGGGLAAVKKARTMAMRGGRAGPNKVHSSTPMVGK